MRTLRLAAPALVLLVASARPGAQGHPSPPPIADDNVSSLITGEFTGDTDVDAVVLANGNPVLRESVASLQTYVWADVTAVDIATVHGGGIGGRDRVVAVGPSGLAVLELSDPPSSWAVPVWLRGEATYWANALAVRTGQVDGLYGDDIVAVTPARVVIAKAKIGGGWETSDVTFLAGGGIDGLELVDWDGVPGGALELAVLMHASPTLPARMRFMLPNGASLGIIYCFSYLDRVVAAPLAAAGIGTRYLAALATDDATGLQELMLLSSADLAGPWSFGEAGVYDIAAGDWNGDGIDDVVLGTTTSRDARLLPVISDAPSQLTLDPLHAPPNSAVLLPVGHPDRNPAVQDGGMSLADIDHDTDLDLVTAVQGEYVGGPWEYLDPRFSAVEYTLNDRIVETDWLPWPAPGSSWPEPVPVPRLDSISGVLTVPLPPPTWIVPDAWQAPVAKYEYAVWHTPALDELCDPDPMPGMTGAVPITNPSDPEFWTTLTLDVDQHSTSFEDLYTLVLRQVKRDAGGAIVHQSPALKVTFYSYMDAGAYSSGWNNLTTFFGLVVPFEGSGGGHSSGAPPPPTPPQPPP